MDGRELLCRFSVELPHKIMLIIENPFHEKWYCNCIDAEDSLWILNMVVCAWSIYLKRMLAVDCLAEPVTCFPFLLQFTQPIRLWQDFDVMKMEGKRLRESLKSKSGTHLDHPSPVRPRFYSAGASSELPKSTRTNIAQVPKPLGRDPSHMTMSLVSSDSQGMQTDCIPATPHSTPHHIEAWLTSCEEGSRRQQLLKTYFCNNCEQMFCLESSLEEHLQSCCSSWHPGFLHSTNADAMLSILHATLVHETPCVFMYVYLLYAKLNWSITHTHTLCSTALCLHLIWNDVII